MPLLPATSLSSDSVPRTRSGLIRTATRAAVASTTREEWMHYETQAQIRAHIRLQLHFDHVPPESQQDTVAGRPAAHKRLSIGRPRVQSSGVPEAAEWSWPFFDFL